MSKTLPSKEQQVVIMHGSLITNVVHAIQYPELQDELKRNLEVAREKGWGTLVDTIHKILAGDRSESLITPMDEEDAIIVKAILMGIQNSDTLPKADNRADGTIAAPSLASMILAAGKGDVQAIEALGIMAKQMSSVGGEMARVGAIFKTMIDGERAPEILTKGMGKQAENLTLSILEELEKLIIH